MRLLDKYIGREVGSHAALGLAVFTFVFFVPQLVRLMDLIVRHSGGIGMVLLIFLCSLIPVLAFTIPDGSTGRRVDWPRPAFRGQRNRGAARVRNQSAPLLLVPIGFVALACGLGTLVLTFWLSPFSVRTLRGLEARLLASQAPYAIQPRVFDERFPHLVLYVQDVEAAATRWRGVFLASSGPAATTDVTIAEGAQVVAGADNNQIELHLGNGSTHEYDPREPASLQRYDIRRERNPGGNFEPCHRAENRCVERRRALCFAVAGRPRRLTGVTRAWNSIAASPFPQRAWFSRYWECRSGFGLVAADEPQD